MTNKKNSAEVGGVALGNLDDPSTYWVNFEKSLREGKDPVGGTTADLIRDGYNNPHPWMMNRVNPDDRKPAFLLGRGWSATLEKRQKIADAGIPAMAVNDYPKDGPKPNYWCSGDGAGNFGVRIWDDVDVMKFCGIRQIPLNLPREDAYEKARSSKDAPNVHFFHHVNDLLEMESWLHVPYIAWGTTHFGPNVPPQFHKEGAARSSMLIGLRLLWHLGYREVYLLGCDCTPHHHPAPNYWKVMFHYIDQLRPIFDRFGYNVVQTNPDSHLRTFEFANFDDIV